MPALDTSISLHRKLSIMLCRHFIPGKSKFIIFIDQANIKPLKGEGPKPARKDILLETREHLEAKKREIQESLDVINYKLDTYDQKCGPITIEMVNEWKKKKELKT